MPSACVPIVYVRAPAVIVTATPARAGITRPEISVRPPPTTRRRTSSATAVMPAAPPPSLRPARRRRTSR